MEACLEIWPLRPRRAAGSRTRDVMLYGYGSHATGNACRHVRIPALVCRGRGEAAHSGHAYGQPNSDVNFGTAQGKLKYHALKDYSPITRAQSDDDRVSPTSTWEL